MGHGFSRPRPSSGGWQISAAVSKLHDTKAFDNRSIDASSAPVMGRPLERLQKHPIILR